MSRSVYSLVLSDDIIQAVDRAAYALGSSRSNLINQILADYVSYTTPEKRMRDTFEALTALIGRGESFLVQSQSSDALLNIRSPLQVKYNPSIKYTVELFRDTSCGMGELRAVTRTQSSALLDALEGFFRLFHQVESRYRGSEPLCQIGRGRYVRRFSLPEEDPGSEIIGSVLGSYIRCMDSALNAYLNAPPEQQQQAVAQRYRAWAEESPLLL